jgi:hypothetical protein
MMGTSTGCPGGPEDRPEERLHLLLVVAKAEESRHLLLGPVGAR